MLKLERARRRWPVRDLGSRDSLAEERSIEGRDELCGSNWRVCITPSASMATIYSCSPSGKNSAVTTSMCSAPLPNSLSW